LAFTTTTGAGGTSLIGTSGVDTAAIDGNFGALYIGAQAANDVINFSGSTSNVRAELGKGADSFSTGSLQSSTVSGNFGNDVIAINGVLSGSGALVNGNQGQDEISVSGSVTKGARVLGGADNDVISVGGSISNGGIVNGNKGEDLIDLSSSASVSSATVFGGEGNDTIITAPSSTDTKPEDLNGVILSGDTGNDNISGGSGSDQLFGGEGNDTIAAGFVAGTTENTLAIDKSQDILTGGAGLDVFTSLGNTTSADITVFNNGTPNPLAFEVLGSSADVITDFNVLEDKIGISRPTAFAGTNQNAQAGDIFAISGTYSGGLFTPKSIAAGGFDTLIAVAGNTPGTINTSGETNNSSVVFAILEDVLANTVKNGNFTVV
jgi:Ca2+-binding RTX toxin-like protein